LYTIQQKKRQEKTPQKKLWKQKLLCWRSKKNKRKSFSQKDLANFALLSVRKSLWRSSCSCSTTSTTSTITHQNKALLN
jgi:hypothetical protein